MRFAGILPALLLAGCATSYNVATEQQESLLISPEREVQMGDSISRRVEEEFTLVRDPELLARLDRVGSRISGVADRRDLLYRFSIVEEKEPNAFALPGGPVYVTTGLLGLARSDDELAAVLGHEVGHIVARHAAKRIQGALGMELLQIVAISTGAADARARYGLDLAFASLMTGYSQLDELEADRLSVRYLKRAGYQPTASIDFLTRLRDHTHNQPIRRFSYFRSHPYFAERIRTVRAEATGQIQFDDYINRAQE